jgi:hypothetical protein
MNRSWQKFGFSEFSDLDCGSPELLNFVLNINILFIHVHEC